MRSSAAAKMRSGQPLTDEDRQPWLQKLAALLKQHAEKGKSCVVACSALRRQYREVLSGHSTNAHHTDRIAFVRLYARLLCPVWHVEVDDQELLLVRINGSVQLVHLQHVQYAMPSSSPRSIFPIYLADPAGLMVCSCVLSTRRPSIMMVKYA